MAAVPLELGPAPASLLSIHPIPLPLCSFLLAQSSLLKPPHSLLPGPQLGMNWAQSHVPHSSLEGAEAQGAQPLPTSWAGDTSGNTGHQTAAISSDLNYTQY